MRTNSLLLVLAGSLEVSYAGVNCLALSAGGSLGLRQYLPLRTALFLCEIALAAGACILGASLWKTGRSYWLALHGIALAAYGALGVFVISPAVKISFLPFATLLALSALSLGFYAIQPRSLRLAGIVSFAFALSFFVVGLHWVRPEPAAFLLWMSSYFAFCALCAITLALGSRHNEVWTPMIEVRRV